MYPNEKVVPDFIVCGKGMSSGVYPLSTCSYKAAIEKSIFNEDAFIHISTTGGSDLGCAVASAMLKIQSDPAFLQHVREVGKIFGDGLKKIASDYPNLIKELRGRGLMWGVEFFNEDNCLKSMILSIQEGVLLNYCGNKKDTLIIMPPLISTEEEINEVLLRISKAIQKLKEMSK
jgi:putrescine aminotransferase